VWQTAVSQTVTLLMLICFLRAINTDPGSVPKTLEWQRGRDQSENAQAQELTSEVKQTGEVRFCKWCNQYKPDRCHHCRVCRSCVLRMDHHCPWIANCVGFRNHKFFLLLVFYGLVDVLFICATMSETLHWVINEEVSPLRRFGVIYGMTLSSLMGMAFVPFMLLHMMFIVQALTTIEFCEKRSKPGVAISYDRGLLENTRAALGPYMLLWLLPVCPPEGDGVAFPHRESSKASSGAAASSSAATPTIPVVVNTKAPLLDTGGGGPRTDEAAAASTSGEQKKEEELDAGRDGDDSPPEVTGGPGAEA